MDPRMMQCIRHVAALFFALVALLALPAVSAAGTDVVRLSEYRGEGSQLMLRGQAPSADLFIPLSSASRIDAAELELYLVNSIALIEDRSVLRVNFNGVTVGQIRLRRDQPQIIATVTLPANLWEPGFNRLQFAASQQTDGQCASPDAPELWTEIDLYTSLLRVEHRGADAPLALADLSGVFGTGIGSASRVTLMTAPGAGGDALDRTLPMISQALALRRNYAALQLRHSAWDTERRSELEVESLRAPATTDNGWSDDAREALPRSAAYWVSASDESVHVLVGRREQLAAILPADITETIDGAHLSFARTPAVIVDDEVRVPATVRLLVSGDSDEDVLTAARVLADMDDRLNRAARVDALQRERAEPARELLPSRFLVPERRYTFSSIGEGRTFRGSGSFRHTLDFNLPPDFHVPESASFKLYLDFGYGAQMGPGSRLNLMLNDQLIHGMPLDQPGGQFFRAYRLDVSARQLRGGSNTLAFDVALRPPQSPQPCTWVSPDHLIFTLHDTSALELPAADSVAVLPDLGLMADTGYPYLQTGETAPVNLYIDDRALTGTALTLAGKLAQAAGIALQELVLADWPRDTPAAGNHLLIGTPDALPEALFRDWSAALGRSQRWPYRSLNDWRALLSGDEAALSGQVEQTGAIGDGALLAALANPAGKGTVSVFTADSNTQLADSMDTLIEPAIWGQLRGDLAAWRDRDSPVHTLQVSGGYVVGDPDQPVATLRVWLSNNPWYWAIGVLVVVTLAAWMLYQLLLRRNRRQQAQWEQ